jgi:hypothetical protein
MNTEIVLILIDKTDMKYNNDDDDVIVIIIMQLSGYLLRCRLNGTSVYYKASKKT